MQKRYNIALLPRTISDKVIALSVKLASLSDTYQLGKCSLPHVTLCQFYATEQSIPNIWHEVLVHIPIKTLALQFAELSLTKGAKHFWVALLPTADACPTLMRLNKIIADIVKNPVSKSYADYDPHITLINSLQANYAEESRYVLRDYQPLEDIFDLTLGESDEAGQYLKRLL